ncbi:glycosyltransferase family 2 protein [Phocaeicola sartorii]|uniref:Glycosyltransferase 2-like domain-containing protein n=1 Tax=Phocaeicola sartorii TaxID=671267 RepID=R9HZU7_9BACT|nr:glycosyltransferase family 2 protein [Phocaeicola sartorii]EOS09548.1 hypothetical protein C802_03661 [Phocaeicola sartorii]MCR1844753.1 glycosyltransferase family 2 protein [Phocaeicola sartorii]
MAIKFEYPFKSKDFFEYVNSFEKYKNVKSNLLFSDVKSQDPLVSVVIPTYKAPYIKEALDSVLRQTETPDYEVVIVENDPGNSNLLEYVKSLKSGRIRYYCNDDNIGMAGNWNRCIELARSENIVFCHSDDMLVEDTLKNLWAFRQKVGPEAAILGRNILIDKDGKFIKGGVCKDRFFGLLKAKSYYQNNRHSSFRLDFDTGVGAMLNRSVMLKLGGYNSDFDPAIDFVMFMNYFCNAPIYRINSIVRLTRIAVNTSLVVCAKFAPCNFYMRKAIVDKYWGGNKILYHIAKLRSETIEDELWGLSPLRNINILEKAMMKMDSIIYYFHSVYSFTRI